MFNISDSAVLANFGHDLGRATEGDLYEIMTNNAVLCSESPFVMAMLIMTKGEVTRRRDLESDGVNFT